MSRSTSLILELLRVKQWIKNLLVFGALIFTNNITNSQLLLKTVTAFFLFSFASSALYIINDVRDKKEDKLHPEKKNRPIASGSVPVSFALALALILAVLSAVSSYLISIPFFIALVSYMLLSFSYSMKLKHLVILDVLIVASGFVIRAAAGALVINVSISPWLLICTSLLALFVVLAKRRHEITLLTDASKHRKILEEYSLPMLDQMISVVTASTVIAYSLYAFTSPTAQKHNYLMLTIPFVLYAIFRYLYLIHKKNQGGSPESVFLKDKPMIIDVLLWTVSSIAIISFIK
jgi:4-hydroxybenzoate polyprenyltransferase